jgi:predicted transcriptional regulator
LPVRWRFQSRRDSLQNHENQKQKPKRKKKGKIAQVYAMHQKGVSAKQIAKKMKLSEWVVRAYIWRAKNPEKYKALLKRYREKKKAKKASAHSATNQTE